MTPFQQHVRSWQHCTRCPLHRNRVKVCLARGDLPAQVLFIGEAPGANEDIVGQPFVGPAGDLLSSIIDIAVPKGVTYCLTNLVGCLPTNEEGKKAGQPEPEEIQACGPRVLEMVQLAKPQLIVCVGTMASDWLDVKMHHSIKVPRSIPQVAIRHPSFILRATVAMKGILIQRAIVAIRNGIEDHCHAATQTHS